MLLFLAGGQHEGRQLQADYGVLQPGEFQGLHRQSGQGGTVGRAVLWGTGRGQWALPSQPSAGSWFWTHLRSGAVHASRGGACHASGGDVEIGEREGFHAIACD